jgi:hypothetical protein
MNIIKKLIIILILFISTVSQSQAVTVTININSTLCNPASQASVFNSNWRGLGLNGFDCVNLSVGSVNAVTASGGLTSSGGSTPNIDGSYYQNLFDNQNNTNTYFNNTFASQSLNNTYFNTSILQLQLNDTNDEAYVNNTFIKIITYNGNFPNNTISNFQSLFDYLNITKLNKTDSILESNVTNLISDLNGKLNISTYSGDFPNSSIYQLQLNDTYFNGSVFPLSENFRNDTISNNYNYFQSLFNTQNQTNINFGNNDTYQNNSINNIIINDTNQANYVNTTFTPYSIFNTSLFNQDINNTNFNLSDTNLNLTKLNPPPVYCTNTTFLQSMSGNNTQCSNIPAAGSLTYYFNNLTSTSTINASKRMLSTPNSTELKLTTAGVTTGKILQNWTTEPGFPGLTFIPAGSWEFHIHANTTGGGMAQIFGDVYEVNATGYKLQKIGTSETSTILVNTETEYRLFFVTANVTTLSSNTSRIMVSVNTTITGGAVTVNLLYGGEADSHLTLPSNTVDATNFVPYNSATQDVNLGNYNITANQIIGNGSQLTGIKGDISFYANNNGNLITTGSIGNGTVHYNGKLNEIIILADQAGNASIDVYQGNYSTYPTQTKIGTITMVNSTKYQDSLFSGFSTTSFSDDDNFGFVINSTSPPTNITWIKGDIETVRS